MPTKGNDLKTTIQKRKLREFRKREEMILEAAEAILIEHDLAGLTMERIAEMIEYSRGTVYQHFSCREDILIELGIRVQLARNALWERAAKMEGNTRERMLALIVGAMLMVPYNKATKLFVHITAAEPKASPERQKALRQAEHIAVATTTRIVREAVKEGDIVLPEGMTPGNLLFSIWSMIFGFSVMVQVPRRVYAQATQIQATDESHGLDMWRKTSTALLDGFGWRPLSSAFDYEKTMIRIHQGIYAPKTLPREARYKPVPGRHGLRDSPAA